MNDQSRSIPGVIPGQPARPRKGPLYVRRAGEVSGPFPRALVYRFIELGRLGPDDEVREQGDAWHRVAIEFAELCAELSVTHTGDNPDGAVDWIHERRRARRRWIEERTDLPITPHGSDEVADERRRNAGRSSDKPHLNVRMSPTPSADTSLENVSGFSMVAILLLGIVAIGLGIWFLVPRVVPQIILLR